MEKKKGKLITFSGIDGSGKSTISKYIYEHYCAQMPSALLSGFGERIFTRELESIAEKYNQKKHDFFSDYINNIAWLCDFSYTAIDAIIPLLNKGITVFVDRYSLCAKVYSTATTEQHIDKMFAIYEYFPIPDVCIYLDLCPKKAMRRISCRNKELAYYESEKFLGKIKSTYEMFIPKESYCIMKFDASRPLDEIVNRIIDSLDKIIQEERIVQY